MARKSHRTRKIVKGCIDVGIFHHHVVPQPPVSSSSTILSNMQVLITQNLSTLLFIKEILAHISYPRGAQGPILFTLAFSHLQFLYPAVNSLPRVALAIIKRRLNHKAVRTFNNSFTCERSGHTSRVRLTNRSILINEQFEVNMHNWETSFFHNSFLFLAHYVTYSA